jgi:hypothetical protein
MACFVPLTVPPLPDSPPSRQHLLLGMTSKLSWAEIQEPIMLTECFNPACRKKLDYLRNGRVIRTIRSATATMSVEHYWLCGTCYSRFDFEFKLDGSVVVSPRTRAVAPSERPLIDYLAG